MTGNIRNDPFDTGFDADDEFTAPAEADGWSSPAAAAGLAFDSSALGEASGLLIIILGNVVAIVLEGVVASVQTVRLEYYEFFSKFFSGSGRPFTPFCLVAKGGRT